MFATPLPVCASTTRPVMVTSRSSGTSTVASPFGATSMPPTAFAMKGASFSEAALTT
jgi:hypothetical protein